MPPDLPPPAIQESPAAAAELRAPPAPPRDAARLLLLALVVGGLIVASLWVVRPFLPATIWAITIVVATWPLLLRLQAVLWHSRGLAVAVTSLVTLVVFVVPFWVAISTILGRAGELMQLARQAETLRPPALPGWVHDLPVIGPQLAGTLNQIETQGLAAIAHRLAPYAASATQYFIALAGSFGLLVVQFLLTVVIASIIHARGEAAGALVLRFARRLAGERGVELAVLSGHAIRAVAIGVMVTALAESLVGGIGMALAGVPFATVLTAVMFVFCVAQAGPGLVLIPAIVWMFAFRDTAHALLLTAVFGLAATIDTVLRPFLIKKEADLPTLLVLAGVIGGLAAFGLVGIFVGPAVLAVTYTLFRAWLGDTVARGTPLSP